MTPNSRFAYIAPTYKQAKNVAWDYLKHYSLKIPRIKINESELRIDYPNGGRITLYGADNPDSLRGIALWGVVFDEYSQQPSNIFSEIISKTLADHLGYAIWIGTPKGKNEFYRMYKEGMANEDWMAIKLTIDDTLEIEQGETVDNLRLALEDDRKLVEKGLMTQDEFEQEWYCSFEAAIRGAYYSKEIAKAREELRIRQVPYDPELKVHTVWDLGVGDSTAIGFYQKIHNELRMIDYLEASGEGLTYYKKELDKKPYLYGSHFAPHDIKVRELTSGKSRLEIAKGLGLDFEIVPSMTIEDGINAGRLVFNKVFIDEEKCARFLDAIAQYQKEWDDKKGCFKDKPLHDWTSHAGDMWRYTAIVEKKMVNEDFTRTIVTRTYKDLHGAI